VLALVGENGAGKSTLMKLLAGIYTPDAGVFRINGHELVIDGPRHAQEQGISIIHQEFNLMPDLTVAQNIFIGREHRTAGLFLDDRALDRRAQDLFDRLGLALDPAEPVEQLTVARQQMVEIAKALSFDAKVLIMDEPTAALNDAEVDVLFELIGASARPRPGSSTSRTAWRSSRASPTASPCSATAGTSTRSRPRDRPARGHLPHGRPRAARRAASAAVRPRRGEPCSRCAASRRSACCAT
jgi:ABC-type lipoprotein export system ATPase subunit